jgi:hypothetical protein
MVTFVAFVVFQNSVELLPELIAVGDALSVHTGALGGGGGGGGVTVTVA